MRLPQRWTVKVVRPYVREFPLTLATTQGEETITIHLGTRKAFATRCVAFKDAKVTSIASYEEYHEIMASLNDKDKALVYDSLKTSSENDIVSCFNRFKNLHLERKQYHA